MSPDQYSAEPYVTPGSIDGRDSPYYGRGGWTWYTGSAAWLFRVTIDHILGIQADFDGLRVNPCLPTEWEQVKLKRYFRGVIYNIVILNNKNLSHGKVEIIVDDQKIEDNLILHQNNATECDVIIYIGIN